MLISAYPHKQTVLIDVEGRHQDIHSLRSTITKLPMCGALENHEDSASGARLRRLQSELCRCSLLCIDQPFTSPS